jgi:diguanylate cyclase (GGDEF)-like protein
VETAQVELCRALASLGFPLSVVTLDSRGALLRIDEDALDLAAGGRLRPQAPFAHALTAAHRAFWDLTQWPTLLATGFLSEAALEFHAGPGQAKPVLSYWHRRPAADGSGILGLLLPGGERQHLLRQLRRTQESLQEMPAAVLQLGTTPEGQVELPYAVGALLDLLGVSCTMVLDNPGVLLAALDAASRERLVQNLLHPAPGAIAFTAVLTPRHSPGSSVELAASRPLGRGPWHCVLTNVTERERLHGELEALVSTDELTRLANRRALLATMDERLRVTRQLAVCFLDCDRFKHINDSLGHAVGDALLQEVARRLRSHLRATDQLLGLAPDAAELVAARLGGDEFVVMATGIHGAGAATALAQRLVEVAAEPYVIGDRELVLTVSVGVALAGPDSTPEKLLRDADTAMYEAKRLGRGRSVLFEPAMHQRVSSALALELDLRQALAAGAIRAEFQPIVEIATGRIRGFEALARWTHPTRGEVSPAEFIAVAEDSGQIAALGDRILQQACEALAGWRAAGLAADVRLSVNLSRAQLLSEELPRRVQEVLCQWSVPPDALQLEVTETIAMEVSGLGKALQRLRTVGVRLSIDDFGTGHSYLVGGTGIEPVTPAV